MREGERRREGGKEGGRRDMLCVDLSHHNDSSSSVIWALLTILVVNGDVV